MPSTQAIAIKRKARFLERRKAGKTWQRTMTSTPTDIRRLTSDRNLSHAITKTPNIPQERHRSNLLKCKLGGLAGSTVCVGSAVVVMFAWIISLNDTRAVKACQLAGHW